MRKPPKEPPEPVERYETIRKYIVALLQDFTFSAKELSGYLRIPEKDVYDHLEHIRKTMNKGGYHLVVNPALCDKCGFIFSKRGRLTKPGKCPICHSNMIIPPFFSVLKYS
jgi:transcriptional regulator